MLHITINGKAVLAEEGVTILDAAKANGVLIPTLCHMENLHSFGTCRICSVEVEGAKTLMAACMTTVREGMVIRTNTKRVMDARKMLYHLILSDHSKNCLSCSRNQSCELQQLGQQLGVFESRFATDSSRHKLDSSAAISRDLSKCILCRRCVAVCNEIQGVGVLNPQHRGFDTVIGPAMDLPIANANCTNCGQCTTVCPVGAIKSVDCIDAVWAALADPNKRVVMQAAPAVRVALGEHFGYPVGTRVTGKLAAAMRALGADDVFDTDWAADLTIMEEGTELLARLLPEPGAAKPVLPMITSCSPGWIKFLENQYPQLLGHLSTCKSPHMMLGAMAKSYYAARIGVDPRDMFVVSIMPCTAKKFEITREEMFLDGLPNVDAVLTTREFSYMLRQAGVDFTRLPDETFDEPMGMGTGAADIFGLTGGVMEAALRTVYALVTGREPESLHFAPIMGLEQVKEGTVALHGLLPAYRALEGVELRVAVTSGLAGARTLMERLEKGDCPYHFIEVMGCPGGCMTGGGQPRSSDPQVKEKRLRALYDEDESKAVRLSHLNPAVQKAYAEYLGQPGGENAHRLLHTRYIRRGMLSELEGLTENAVVKPVYMAEKKQRERPMSMRQRQEMESVKVRALEKENELLKEKIEDMEETEEILKSVISDYMKKP